MILTASNYGAMYEGVLPIANFDECDTIEPVDFSGYTLIEATYKILEEDAANWNNMIQSAAMLELQYLKENGVEIVYEEEEIVGEKNSWLSKMTAAIKSWFAKIMGMIKNAATSIAASVTSAISSIGVNKKIANPVWPHGKKFETPDYFKARTAVDNLNLIDSFDLDGFNKGNISALKAATKTETFAKDLAAAVKTASGKDGDSCSAGDIKKHILSKINDLVVNGGPETSYDRCLGILQYYKGDIKAIREMQNKAKEATNGLLKNLKAIKKDIAKDSKLVGVAIKTIGKINAFNTNLISAKLSIHASAAMLARKIAVVYTHTNTKSAIKDAPGNAGDAVKGAKDKAGAAIRKNVAKVTKSDAKDDKAATKAAAKDVEESALFSRIPDIEIV